MTDTQSVNTYTGRRKYIDFHSHVLPGIDDGCSDVKESLSLLHASLIQGVYCMAATPHFYADRDTLDHFLNKRERSFLKLTDSGYNGFPVLLKGAEVRYFKNMSDVKEIELLCLHKSELLLVEMPFQKWTTAMIDEILMLNERKGIKVVLAHIDRYMSFQSKETIPELVKNGVLMQVNGEAMNGMFGFSKYLKMIKSGYVHFLGSDSHNMKSRPQNLSRCYLSLRKKWGEAETEDFVNKGLEYIMHKRETEHEFTALGSKIK